MFAQQLAQTETKSPETSSNQVEQKSPSVVPERLAGRVIERTRFSPPPPLGNQAMLRRRAQPGARPEPRRPSELFLREFERTRKPGGETPQKQAWVFSNAPRLSPDEASPSQAKLLTTTPALPGILQAKLEIGAVDDPLEREADRVAEHVMRMPEQAAAGTSDGDQVVRRKCAECQEEDEEHKKIARKESGGAAALDGTPAPPIVHEVLRSPGQPLDAATRAFFEPRFGRDFSGVSVHIDEEAAKSARQVGASAYTVGHQTVFNAGRYAPDTPWGRQLLAHELAHVVQQNSAGNRGRVASPKTAGLLQRREIPIVEPDRHPLDLTPDKSSNAAQSGEIVDPVVLRTEEVIILNQDEAFREDRVTEYGEGWVNVGGGRQKKIQYTTETVKHRSFDDWERWTSRHTSVFAVEAEYRLALEPIHIEPIHQEPKSHASAPQSSSAFSATPSTPKTKQAISQPKTAQEKTPEQELLEDMFGPEMVAQANDMADDLAVAHAAYLKTGRIPRTRNRWFWIEIEEGHALTASQRYDAMLKKTGREYAVVSDVIRDARDPKYLSKEEFAGEFWGREQREWNACDEEHWFKGPTYECQEKVEEKFGGAEFVAWEQNEARRFAADWARASRNIEAIVNSGPTSLFGRVVGRVSGSEKLENILAATGGLLDSGLAGVAGSKAQGRFESYQGGGGLEVGLGEIANVVPAEPGPPAPTPDPVSEATQAAPTAPTPRLEPIDQAPAHAEPAQPLRDITQLTNPTATNRRSTSSTPTESPNSVPDQTPTVEIRTPKTPDYGTPKASATPHAASTRPMRRPPQGTRRGSIGGAAGTPVAHPQSSPIREVRTQGTPDYGQPEFSAGPESQGPDPWAAPSQPTKPRAPRAPRGHREATGRAANQAQALVDLEKGRVGMQEHRTAPEAREALGQVGQGVESTHLVPQAVYEATDASPDLALTVNFPKAVNTAIDRFWKPLWARATRLGTPITGRDIRDLVLKGIRSVPDSMLPQLAKNTLEWRLDLELQGLGITDETVIRPGVR